MAYYDFLMNQWVLGKLSAIQIQNAVTKGYLTQAEADEILAIPRVETV